MITQEELDRPVRFQGSYTRGRNEQGGFIKFSAMLRAYGIYSAKFGTTQSAERLAERGGFAPEELDLFYPEWRNHIVEPI